MPSSGGGGAPAGGGARARSEPDLGRAGHGHDASMRRRWRRVLLAAPPTISLLPPSSRPSLVEAARRASMRAAAAAVLCPGESRRRKLRASAATAFVRGVAVQALACSTCSGGGCWRCTGRCPLLQRHVPRLPPSVQIFSGGLLHLFRYALHQTVFGGEIPAWQRPALSTAKPEGDVTSLEALA